MRSGKRRQALAEAGWTALAAFLVAGLAVSCGYGTRFERSLDRLDLALGRDDIAGIQKLLDSAARRADNSADWLRLLSRAFRAARATGDPQAAARIADSARKAYPAYENIALAACRAYLDAGRTKDAMALFPAPLDPRVRGSWFAEAFIEASRAGGRDTRSAADVEMLGLLSELTGSGEPSIDAALLRMGAGDAAGAAAFLRSARSLGTPVDPDLAWDAGALDSLLSDSGQTLDGKALLRKADAARLLGESGWAREYLLELVLSSPQYSWKPYTALAALEEDRLRGDHWYERMMELFPSEREAVLAWAAYLARTGRGGKALAELESRLGTMGGDARTAVLEAEIRGRLRPQDPPEALALRISNDFPDDVYAQRWALGRLAESERYAQAAEAYRQLKARGLDLGSPWYFEALSRILENRIPEAIAILEKDGPSQSGPEAPFALGVLYAHAGNYKVSAERFRIAVSVTRDPEGKAGALTELGKSLEAAGDRKGARDAWTAALSLRPDSVEALRLLTTRYE